MRLSITGFTAALILAAAPAWADSWKNESGPGWRNAASFHEVRHGDDRWERRHRYWERSHRYSERHHPRAHQRHWQGHRHYGGHRHYHPAPRYRHHPHYNHYGYRYPGAHFETPGVWFSWTIR